MPSFLKTYQTTRRLEFLPRLVLVTLWAAGCASKPAPQKVMQLATCKYNLQSCHIRARSMCSSGYSMQSKDRIIKTGGPWGRYTEYQLRYTCN